jgi:hypothetical protein
LPIPRANGTLCIGVLLRRVRRFGVQPGVILGKPSNSARFMIVVRGITTDVLRDSLIVFIRFRETHD